VRAASSRPSDAAQAVRSLEPVIADAADHGLVEYAMEARLALGEAAPGVWQPPARNGASSKAMRVRAAS
jgi:hypothetical protein